MAAAVQALKISRRRSWRSSMMAAKKTEESARKPETAMYIGPFVRSVMTVRDRMPPTMNRVRSVSSGATLREILRPTSAQRPMSATRNSS